MATVKHLERFHAKSDFSAVSNSFWLRQLKKDYI